jgi:hypothetical protein
VKPGGFYEHAEYLRVATCSPSLALHLASLIGRDHDQQIGYEVFEVEALMVCADCRQRSVDLYLGPVSAYRGRRDRPRPAVRLNTV